jgi:glycolate oxidase FAD binding subunit
MDLIHPHTKADVVEVVAEAHAHAQRLLVVGGRRHMDKGNPCVVDAELWTTMLDEVVEYEPAEMIAVVEAGIRVGDLNRILAEGGQEWPADVPADATVGGVIAAAASSPRRLRVGPVRDTLLEAEVVTGDGRTVRSGARVVKSVAGYDLHKLIAGSLGTLAVILQVALKVRPLPKARRVLRAPGSLALAEELLDRVPSPAGLLATPDAVEVLLEGWPEEVDEQTEIAKAVAPELEVHDDGAAFPSEPSWEDAEVVVEAAVPPSALEHVVPVAGERWGALAGVGLLWAGLDADAEPLEALRATVAEHGGSAPVIHGPGGLGETRVPALEIQRRLKRVFDPNGVLAPGRSWGGI